VTYQPRMTPPECVKLSVVINNYNYARYLRACIDSVICQMASDTEIIVVDDGSTDGSLEVLRSYGELIRVVVQRNAGQAAAMNAGVAAAAGEILLLLDADDLFHPDKIAAIHKVFAGLDPEKPACLTHRFTWIDRDGRSLPGIARMLREHLARLRSPGRLRRVMSAPQAARTTARYGYLAWPCETRTSMFCLNRAMADRVFPIPARGARLRADEFVVRGAMLSGDFYCLERALTAYRDHGGNGWLHGTASKTDREFQQALADYLTEKYRAAGGEGRVDPEDAVVTYIYVRDDLSIAERWRRSWRRSPRDLKSLAYLALLIARRTPYWLGRNAARRLRHA